MLTQHARIRGLAMQLSDELKQDEIREDTLRNLREQLEAHIRLEERQVLPPSSRKSSPSTLSRRYPPGWRFSSRDHLMSAGFRRKGYPSTLGPVRETAKVVARTDTG
jgi:hypothetical protein